MTRRGQTDPIHISGALGAVMKSAAAAAASPAPEPERPRKKSPQGRGRTPLTENGFTALPRALDDLVIRLAKRSDGRTLSRTLTSLLMDLARHTDNDHGDVIVTNKGIAERRVVSLTFVKATIKLLLELHVLQKTEPADERLFQLQQVPGGFSGKRRYLVWNPQAKWRLPDSDDGLATVITLWNDYVGKTDEAETRAQGKGSPRSPIACGEEVFGGTSF